MHSQPLSSAITGSYPERGFVESLVSHRHGPSLRVCVQVLDFQFPERQLAVADALLPALLHDLEAVESLVNREHPEARVWQVWVNADGTATYTCGPQEAEEEELVNVLRSSSGSLAVQA
jgi:hypothetical protein